MTILYIIILVFAVEATAEIITSSKITDGLRRWWALWTIPADRPREESWLQSFRVFVNDLLSCGYCTSVWTAAFFALFAPLVIPIAFVNWLVMTFALHRMANWLHVIYERIRKGRVLSVELEMLQSIPEEEEQDGIS